jgi:hypothetical protein
VRKAEEEGEGWREEERVEGGEREQETNFGNI